MNKDKLLEVKQYILDHPEQLDMNVFVQNCGTTACIAGRVCLLGNVERNTGDGDLVDRTDYYHDKACEILDMSYSYGNQLFYRSSWPFLGLCDRYNQADDDNDYKAMAEVTAEAIDLFLENYDGG